MASRLAEQHGAEVVMWFYAGDGASDRLTVRLALPAEHRLLERDLGGGGSLSGQSAPSSATLEAAALVVREALQLRLAGGAVGDHAPAESFEGKAMGAGVAVTSESVPTPSAKLSHAECPPLPPPCASQLAPASSASTAPCQRPLGMAGVAPVVPDRPVAQVGLAWQVLLDGAGSSGTAEALAARAGVRWSRLHLYGSGSISLPREISDTHLGTFSLVRGGLSAGADFILLRGPFEGTLGARVGVVVYDRGRTSPASGITGTGPDLHLLGAVAPELRLRAPVASTRAEIEFAAGADMVPGLRVGYSNGAANFTPVVKLWSVQPYLMIGLATRM
jgi:hypothetical protein